MRASSTRSACGCRRPAPGGSAVSSHKGVVSGFHERLDAYAAVVAAREARILAFLSAPRRLADFVEAALIYGRYAYRAELLRYWEGEMVAKHLARLAGEGRARREGDVWRAA